MCHFKRRGRCISGGMSSCCGGKRDNSSPKRSRSERTGVGEGGRRMNDMTTNQIAKQTRGLSVTIPGDTQVQAGCPIAQAIAKWFCFPFQNPINEKFRPSSF